MENWDQIGCYGATEDDVISALRSAVKVQFVRNPEIPGEPLDAVALRKVVASLLSDVQEMIERGLNGQARKTLNVAKLALFEPNRIIGD